MVLCSEKETVSNSKVLRFQSLNVRRWTKAFPVDLNWTTFSAKWCQCFQKLFNRTIISSESRYLHSSKGSDKRSPKADFSTNNFKYL